MLWSFSVSDRYMSAWKPLLNPRLYIISSATVPIVRKMESRAVLTTAGVAGQTIHAVCLYDLARCHTVTMN